MQKFRRHVKKHAKKILVAGRRAHKKLHSPVHVYIGWYAIGLAAVIGSLVMTGAVAQTVDQAPAQQQVSSASSTGAGGQQSAAAQPAPQYQQSLPPANPSQQPQNSNPPPPCPAGQNCGGDFNNGPGPQNQGPYNQGGPNQQWQRGGPDDEKMNAKRLEMRKRELNMLVKEVGRVKSQIKSLQKKNADVPEELTQALAKIEELSAKAKSTENAEDLNGVFNDIQDAAQTVREWMPKLQQMAMLPQVIRQAEKELGRAQKAVAADERKIKASKMDLNSQLEEFRQAVLKQQALLDEIRQLAKTAPDEAMDKLRDDFFGSLDNMWENEKIIQISLNIRKGIGQMDRETKEAQKIIKILKGKKLDTSELEQLLADSKAQLEELKNLASVTPIDTDAVIDAVEKLMDIKQSFGDKVQEMTGDSGVSLPPQGGGNFQFNMPQSFNQPMQKQDGGPGGGF